MTVSLKVLITIAIQVGEDNTKSEISCMNNNVYFFFYIKTKYYNQLYPRCSGLSWKTIQQMV